MPARHFSCGLLALAFFCATTHQLLAQENPPAEKWQKEMAAFAAEDEKTPPTPGGVVFVGSSSIRLWDLKKSFPDQKYVNRGFGGSQIADSVKHADRLILPHQPKLIVFYAGDNDIAGKKSPPQVAADFQALVKIVHEKLPQTKLAYIAIKPSPSRWKLYDQQAEANRLIREVIASDKLLTYVDVVAPMLGADGQPRAELFQKDMLHLNAEGYALWNKLLSPVLSPSPSGS
jgi:lysophospholipase L1-like esterase